MRRPSRNLSECVEHGFALLHNNSKAMQESNLPSRHAGELILSSPACLDGIIFNSTIVCCESHNSQLFNMIIRTIVN